MILEIPKEMKRVSADQFKWFVKSLADPKDIIFVNGEGVYEGDRLVAARLSNDTYYVLIKLRG